MTEKSKLSAWLPAPRRLALYVAVLLLLVVVVQVALAGLVWLFGDANTWELVKALARKGGIEIP